MWEDAQREVLRHGIHYVHWKILWYVSVANRYSNTVQGLVKFLAQTKGSISQSLQVLERRGLIERHRDETDRRVVRLSITEDGAAILTEMENASRVRAAAGLLDAHRASAAVDALTELLRNFQMLNCAATFGVCSTCTMFETEGDALRCAATGDLLSASDSVQLCRHHTFAR